MFGKIISAFAKEDPKEARHISRRHARRAGDQCVTLVDGKMLPVENWSAGGLLVAADDRLFALNQDCNVTLKFKLRDKVLDIAHSGKVIRKSANKIAIQFTPLTKAVQDDFKKVVDDFVTQRFIETQSI